MSKTNDAILLNYGQIDQQVLQQDIQDAERERVTSITFNVINDTCYMESLLWATIVSATHNRAGGKSGIICRKVSEPTNNPKQCHSTGTEDNTHCNLTNKELTAKLGLFNK